MNTGRRNIPIFIGILCILISGCRPGGLFGPARIVSVAAGGITPGEALRAAIAFQRVGSDSPPEAV